MWPKLPDIYLTVEGKTTENFHQETDPTGVGPGSAVCNDVTPDHCGGHKDIRTILNRIQYFLIFVVSLKWYSLVVSSLQAMRAYGDMDARVHIFAATALRRGSVASPAFGRFYPLENPRYSFYRRLSEHQYQSGHKGAKKNLHPSDTRNQTRDMIWCLYV